MTREEVREAVINTYIKNNYNFEETLKVLATLPELSALSRKQVQGILVFAKIWKPLKKEKSKTKGRITKKDLLPELEKLGINTEGLEDATLKGLQNLIEWATKHKGGEQ